MKTCSKCGFPKYESEFFACKKHADGKQSECKDCHQKMNRAWQKANPETCRELDRRWKKENATKVKEQAAARYKANPEKRRAASLRWQEANIEKSRETRRRSEAKRRGTPKGKLSNAMSCGIRASLRNNKGRRHWETLVNFTIDHLKRHLEKLFTPEMTWDNFGTVWHVDHQIPIAVFNFEKPEHIDFQLCWSLKNLQPLQATKNISKGCKLSKPFQPSLAMAVGG